MKRIIATALVCCSLAVQAETETAPVEAATGDMDSFDIMASVGLTIGGDDLAVTTNDVTVTSGGLLYFAIGGVFHINPSFDVQASFGYHFDTVNADNGTAEFTRTFFELLPFYVMEGGNRFGIGFTQVMSPEFTNPLGGGITFEDATGMIVEYDWQLAPNYYIGARYANLTYDSADGPIIMPDFSITDSIDGSYIGVILQGNF